MRWNPFRAVSKECLGIDVGTFSIKIAELAKKGKEMELGNYGEIKITDLYPNGLKKNILSALSEEIADAILAIIKEAKIKTKTACFSLPDYASFFTTFTLPPMSQSEIPEAVRYEAPLHIPLPLNKVTLDWQVVEGSEKENKPFKILLVAIPNDVIDKYREIAVLAKLELVALEAEVFGLIRALIKSDQPTLILDIGAESTTINIIDKKLLRLSHSFDVAGNKFTEAVGSHLKYDNRSAEKIKNKVGVSGDSSIKEVLIPYLNSIGDAVREIRNNFFREEGKMVESLILAGGSSLLPGLKEYFSEGLSLRVEAGDPFLGLIVPPILKEPLKKMAPLYAIAVGMALRGLK